MSSDASILSFKVYTRSIVYGDKRTFINFNIGMFAGGKPVGIERGPQREFSTRGEALKAARRRIRELRTHNLFVIRVTRRHIAAGDGRNCNTCAIAQALWSNQERMGYPKHKFNFEVSPYGSFASPRGIVLSEKYSSDSGIAIEADCLPDVVLWQAENGRIWSDRLIHWAMNFDDWADARFMSLREWREKHGKESDERPYTPGPCSFVLDLDAFRVAA